MRIQLVSVGLSVLSLASLPVSASAPQRPLFEDNYIEVVRLPEEQRDDFAEQVALEVAASAVPTARDAEKLAASAAVALGLSAQDTVRTTGLFRLGRDLPSFGVAGALFWEVRVQHQPAIVVRVFWVSTTTMAVNELVPTATPTLRSIFRQPGR
jgi:hypothetical protein